MNTIFRIKKLNNNENLILNFVFILVLILFPNRVLSQKSYSTKQVDSILNYYTKIPATGENQQKYVKEIDKLLPQISADSAKLVLITKKSLFNGTNLKDQPSLLKNHLAAKKIIYSLKNSEEEKVIIHLGIAETYKYLKMYELANQNLRTAFDILKHLPKNPKNVKLAFVGYFIEIDVLFHLKKIDSCIKKSEYVLQQKNLLQIPEYIKVAEFTANHYLGKCYLAKNNIDTAEKYFKLAEKLDIGALPDLTIANNNDYAKLLIEKNQYQLASEKLKSLGLSDNSKYPEEYSDRYQLLSKIYAQKGDLELFNRYTNKKDSLDKTYKAVEMKALEEAQLYTESEHQKNIQDKNNIIWVILPFGIIAFGFMLYFINKKKNDQQKYFKDLEDVKHEAEKAKVIALDESLNIDKDITNKNSPLIINEEIENNILTRLNKFEALEKFKDHNLSLPSLAAQLKTNTTYLSEIINKQKGKNYNAYINDLRINYIVNKLNTDPKYLTYKISYLAEDCGFSSHSSFATIFKNTIGISPSIFIQNLKNEIDED